MDPTDPYPQHCLQVTKKSAKQEYHFVEQEHEGRKPGKNSRLRRLEFMPGNLDFKCRSKNPVTIVSEKKGKKESHLLSPQARSPSTGTLTTRQW
jgi:hypothetical protein